MNRRSSATEFGRLVEKAISAALASGTHTFRGIVDQLPGAFPLVVAKHLEKYGIISSPGSAQPRVLRRHIPSDFVFPHPLDYDWRFSAAAVDQIEKLVRDAGAPQRQVVCVGCPTVAAALSESFGRDVVWLFDRNGSLHDAAANAWDFCEDSLPQLGKPIVVTDPPWYPNYFRTFLWAIREASQPGTDLLMAVPPLLTRPGMKTELRQLRTWVQAVGFEVIESRPSALPYVTPLFELNTLRTYGGSDVSLDWRKADLWRLRIVSKPVCKAPTRPPADNCWNERRFGATRLRYRTGIVVDDLMILHPLGENGVLSSVSSRDPLRSRASVVTSGGRFFTAVESPLHRRSASLVKKKPQRCVTLGDVLALEHREESEYYDLIRKIIRR